MFVLLVLSNGSRYLGYGAGRAVAVDATMVVVFLLFLRSTRDPYSRVPSEPDTVVSTAAPK
jgi:hypothetical protein